VRPVEDGPAKIGAAEIRAVQVGVGKVDAAQIGTVEVDECEVRAAADQRSREACPAEW